jgi:hypothetical protein
MSEITGEASVRVEVPGDRPLVVNMGTESVDDVYSVMANEHRRHALAVIAREPEAMNVSRLVEQVADRLKPEPTEAASDRSLRELRVSLHHQHLPKMVSAGLVEYDAENRTVKPTSAIVT